MKNYHVNHNLIIKNTEMSELKAPVRWAQRKDLIYLQLDVSDCKNETVELTNEKLHFKATGGDKNTYVADVTFNEEVTKEGSKWAIHGRSVVFVIMKKENNWWPRLTKEKTKFSWLSVDWSKWVDEDDAEDGFDLDTGGFGGFDASGLGGAGGFDASGLGGDFGDDDEDDGPEENEAPKTEN
eukprot:TRINITY_DN8276_c0_g1_i1.p1 TRINITY_DN8276_c0_g1~~TRINITY_DN8276_c0_g1_i1.p1  ORF type:complete len:182 (-),score=56.46 TRINITY_DN8276_c0_g1_i1:83-628(-)